MFRICFRTDGQNVWLSIQGFFWCAQTPHRAPPSTTIILATKALWIATILLVVVVVQLSYWYCILTIKSIPRRTARLPLYNTEMPSNRNGGGKPKNDYKALIELVRCCVLLLLLLLLLLLMMMMMMIN